MVSIVMVYIADDSRILDPEDVFGFYRTSERYFTIINVGGGLLLMHAWCKDKGIRRSRESDPHCDSGKVGESDEPRRFEGDMIAD